MKKISILFFAAIFAAMSCNKEIQEDPTSTSKSHPMTFTATTTETRTVLDDDYVSIKWLSTDKISVFDGDGNKEFSSDGEGSTVHFNGNAVDADLYYAVYPYTPDATLFGMTVRTTLDANQEPVVGSFADGLNINAAMSTSTEFVFDNVLSVAKFTIDGTQLGGKTIKSVKFTSSYALAGDVVITFSAEGITAAAGDESVKEVTLEDGNGLADGTYYFVVLPNEGGEISMTFESTDGYFARKTATLGKAFTAGNIKNLGTVKGLVWTKFFFYESFDQCKGTGGNDGKWDGSIASSTLTADNEGWTFTRGGGADKCAKFGAGSAKGIAQTPELNLPETANISFRAGAWNGNSEATELVLTSSNATLNRSSVNMIKAGFTDYDLVLSEVSSGAQVSFEGKNASNSRFFLDEVLVYVGNKALAMELATGTAPETIPVPIISPGTGTYTSIQTVTITAEGADKILYGIDNDPTIEYTSSLTIGASCTLKAVAVKGGLTSEAAVAVYTIDIPGTVNAKYDFSKIDGFDEWSTPYLQHVVDYPEAVVTFASANHQTSTITDVPVTKGNDVSVVLKNGTMSKVKFVCKQWTNKAQTITLHYSTNSGTSYTSTGITSTNFTIEDDALPANTNAVKITFSSTNQVGISSVEFTNLTVSN